SSFSGGAHSNAFFRSQTFWRDGDGVREVNLSNLFLEGTPWRRILSQRILELLREQEATWVVVGELTAVDEEMLAFWSLTPGEIQFEFEPYAVGSYAEGAHRAALSNDELREL